MKLRLRDDSMRLRLTRSEVAALVEAGMVEASTRFAPDCALRYRVVADGSAATVSFRDNMLTVALPAVQVRLWAASDEIVLAAEQIWPGGGLRVSIEKDLACAKPRAGEDTSDAFPATLGRSHCT